MVLEIRDNKLQFEGPWGKGIDCCSSTHKRLKNAASPSLELLNITKLYQLNSYIDQKDQYESMAKHIVTTELELFDSTPKTNCRKHKLLTRREKSSYNKDFLLDSYKALEEKLLSYRDL
ncbi:hypothetical protein Droror1_Dr00011593 [Drosera rotundifolia]